MNDDSDLPRERTTRVGADLLLKRGTRFQGQYGHYIVSDGLLDAANTAYMLNRPLLLTGEPGCGKTDFAWVAAHARGFRPSLAKPGLEFTPPGPLRCQVRSDMTARELLYHYDALLRFVDSHHPERRTETTELRRYFELRGLGKALCWPRPERPVLLIDEIDKAPRDLPNDLLQALDEGLFEIAELRENQDVIELQDGFEISRVMGLGRADGARRERSPFVVITSNAEQQLPEPFLRRCIFYHIEFPELAELIEIVRLRLDDDEPMLEVVDPLVKVFMALRDVDDLIKKPATSELLDWVEALRLHWDFVVVKKWIVAFAKRIGSSSARDRLKLREGRDVKWRNLLGLECLLKLRRDLWSVRES